MSNKNIFLILALCVSVGAVYYLSNNKEKLNEISDIFTKASSSKITFDTTSQGDVDADSLIKTLNSQMLMVGMINPRNIDPAVNQFQSFREKFTKTKLWTKLNLDAMIASQIGESSGPVAGMPTSPAEFFELVRNEWKGIKEVVLAVSRTTTPIEGPTDDPINFPKILLALNFGDQSTQNRIKEIVSSQIPKGENTLTQDALTLVRSKENPDHYDVSVKSPFGAPLFGSIEFSGSQGFVTFGTKQKADFFTSKAGGSSDAAPLVDSEVWQQAQVSILPQSGSLVFLDVKGVTDVSKDIQKAVSLGEDPNFQGSFVDQTLNEFGTVGFSSNFSDGVKFRACGSTTNPESTSRYRAMLNWSKADNGSETSASNLITKDTIFSSTISGHFIQAYLDNAISMYKVTSYDELQKSAEKFTPETKRMIENYLVLNKLSKANPIRNISFVINAPQTLGMESIMGGPPPVDSNVLIEFKSAMTPTNFTKLVNKIITLFTADSEDDHIPSAKVAQASEGLTGEVIQLSDGVAQQFFGAPISENSLLFGKSQASLLESKKKIQQPSTIVSDEALNTKGLKELRSSAGVSSFLSTMPLVQLLHTLAPQALSMAPPEMQLSIEDVKEVLNLLNVQLLGVQNTSQASEEVYCSDMRGVVL